MDENIIDTEKFYIKTKLEKNDYRKFIFFSTFMKNWHTIIKCLILSIVASIAVCYILNLMSIIGIISATFFYFVVAVLSLIFKAEIQQKKTMKSDNTGAFNSLHHLRLYENDIVIQNEKIEGYQKIKYSQFFEVIESKYFYLLYLTRNQVLIIRKIDVDDTQNLSNFLKEKFDVKYSKR